MVCARLVLLLAALMLLACPLVKSVPVDYVDPQEAEDVVATPDPGCVVQDFKELRQALTDPAAFKAACVIGGTKAVILLKCTGTFDRGTGATIQLNSGITDWTIKPFCNQKQVNVKIDFTDGGDNVNVLAAKPTSTGVSFFLSDLIFNFPGSSNGKCADDAKPCAVIKVEGFKDVTIKNTNIHKLATSTQEPSRIPASGILIKDADTITLTKVEIKKVAESGIQVLGGGFVDATDVVSTFNSKHGLHIDGCGYERQAAKGLSLVGSNKLGIPKSSFVSNGGAGLLMDCVAAPVGAAAVPVDIKYASFNKNTKHGLWLLGSFNVATTKCKVELNGGSTSPQCGGGVRAVLRNTAGVGTRLELDGTSVKGNKARYGAGVCFQARWKADGSTDYKHSLLRLTGATQLKDNEATECGGALATVANMVDERLAISIAKTVLFSNNKAPKGKGRTWCDVTDTSDDADGVTWKNFKPIWLGETYEE